MTWEQLVARLQADLRSSVERDGVVTVSWRTPDEPPELQEVRVERGDVAGAPWVVLNAPAVERTRLDDEAALRRNAGIAIGAIVLLGDTCFIRHAAPLAAMTWTDIERAMHAVATEAIRLRRAGRAVKLSPYTNYAE